jgi:L-asparaginase II
VDPISVAVTRGTVVEARHLVHAVLVRDGAVAAVAGDADHVTFWRSGAKPFQALQLVREVEGLRDDEVAIACASHEGRPEQLAAVQSLLARAGAEEQSLECGPEAVGGGTPSRLAHNCSGKHAGMLLVCRGRGWPLAGYRLARHPLQQELYALVRDATGVDEAEVPTAVDGCGVPTFALPLWRMALAFSRLPTIAGGGRILAAMSSRPDLVGGPEVIDTLLMRELPGAVAKRGAEGLVCGLLPDGSGFALKAQDGAQRPLAPAAARFLGISVLAETPVVNSRGERVGAVTLEGA